MTHLPTSIVAILDTSGQIVGTGFVAAADIILTCAHVVLAAGSQEGEQVRVRFHEGKSERDAVVEVCPERPLAPGAVDVAVLRVDGALPEGVKALALGYSSQLKGQAFEAFGYPNVGDIQGIHADGLFDGEVKNEAGHSFLQLDSKKLERGMSGGPIMAKESGLVVGMITKGTTVKAAANLRDTKFGIPAEMLVFDGYDELVLHLGNSRNTHYKNPTNLQFRTFSILILLILLIALVIFLESQKQSNIPQADTETTNETEELIISLVTKQAEQSNILATLQIDSQTDVNVLATATSIASQLEELERDIEQRTSQNFLDFEEPYNCFVEKDEAQETTGTIQEVISYDNSTALELTYDLGVTTGNWVQIRCEFEQPIDVSDFDHFRFNWRGEPSAANSLTIGFINFSDSQDHVFGRSYHHLTQQADWGQIIIPFDFLAPWSQDTNFDSSQISAFFIGVVKDPYKDNGNTGSIVIDNLSAIDVKSRTISTDFETGASIKIAANATVNWIANQQQPNGLVKSWEEEPNDFAHLRDQALALLVFTHNGMWTPADSLVEGLVQSQNADGSWYTGYYASDLAFTPINSNKFEGDIAWVTYALNRYIELGGNQDGVNDAREKAVNWLVMRINSSDGCLNIDHTAATLITWWALSTADIVYSDQANNLQTCLLTRYWDEESGRFKAGQNWFDINLVDQTLGAAFLKAIDENTKALSALSYAQETLTLAQFDGQSPGLSGQSSSSFVWNEGLGQYISLGGEGANSLLLELLAQQQLNGGMPGSNDEFSGGGIWGTTWTGISPTAWLYFALCGDPFNSFGSSDC